MDCMMYWDFWWLMLGGAAFVLVIVNLVRALRKKYGGWQVMLAASLSCGALAMLSAYVGVCDWVQEGNLIALMEDVPAVAKVCVSAVCWGCLLNFFALFIHTRPEKGDETDEKG